MECMNTTGESAAHEQPTTARVVGSDRVLAVLVELARHPDGVGLDGIAKAVGSPKPTVHRALASLRRSRLADQDGYGRYVLGDEFLRMAFAHHEARPDHVRVQPVLDELAERYRETAHYAVLDGRDVVYRSKVDPPSGAVQLSSTIGGRNPAHCTAVGKVLLAFTCPDDAAVRRWAGGDRLERRTENTITTTDALCAELETIRQRGYGIDDQESEQGVNCLALPAFLTSPTTPSGAVSVSGLFYRTPVDKLVAELPVIRSIVGARLGREQE